MASVPTGTTFWIASTFAAAKTVTAISNAAEAVVSATAHGFVAGDAVEMTSGWGRLNRRVFEVKSATTDSFVLSGADTTNLNFFPAGTGAGSVRKVNAFQQITQVTAASSSGGDPQTVNYKYLESDVGYSINDGFAATQYQLTMDADAIGTAGYDLLKTLTDVQTDTCLKMMSRSGARLYLPCTVALNDVPSLNDGQINTVTAVFNGNNRPIRYKAA
ncbi:phage tail tube protein [Comamonas sp. JUb58]|uniref:phage tail tube protein n=1 Tax=Comamonas sp. JUb58 TaxID=2485114 RepID=UPI00105FEE82|nr:phage tail tube protein [Comamonas sp. JUb58]TDS68148.1 tail tube protein [Comamonas sp. JUb58]